VSGPAAIILPPAPISAAETEGLFADLAAEQCLLIAVSGGPDSVALLGLLAEWAVAPGRPRLAAATVDHGLRDASAAEAHDVAGLCHELGVPHAILTWEGDKPATAVQARARAARYDLLAREAQRAGASVVVTAHTLDDQAETLMMRMAHGSGPSGLAGMRARVSRDGLVLARPLLCVSKDRLIATARARGLPYVEDPSNANRRFERVRWRALMPSLAEAGLEAGRLGLLARRIARMDDALSQRASRLWSELVLPETCADGVALRFTGLLEEPEEIALRVVSRALDHVAGDRLARLERLETCLGSLLAAARAETPATRTLSGCVLALRRDGVLSVRREPPRKRGVHPAAS
jgi:tRNA(Ile)-lysidine synthase